MKLPDKVRSAHGAGWTVFYLPLTDASVVSSIKAELEAMGDNPSQLLFLRRLRKISLTAPELALDLHRIYGGPVLPVVALWAFSQGLQNSITRKCRSLPVCTTHMTGYLTDL